ncbi:MAG TPA: iron-sulfur cluster assembly scaffold protein [Candidatus Pacearchaeota archaeon]|nr:iron-sulfur cluster assembly scaffold protein [Candidatus Pacearchaeota archaeon]HOF44081.1 iron-sulfur cluster assembly scaffold protein [Candidatus Pacearchaeota archaeon]HOH04186.1 iron-sulfur cluster assembly scaffold protein [Candidatus Pacearchaeota archaeon]HOU79399.1 iron-sulfur cluster assembly scaffold protein [Candidatus Pacearchaeota archaeon]HPJ87035.1 iron-sulfur cluster assembly scaffold protein [Candidatus Pacearchaeota archaeon]
MVSKYNKKVLKEFTNPKNMGEIKNANGIGKIGNPTCGDILWVYIKVEKDKKGEEILTDIKFKTFGCAAAIATSSMITKLAKGKKLSEVEKISYKDVVDALGGLPNIKIHCSAMASQALKKAIEDYKNKIQIKKRVNY